jgi:hypothetical protein
VEGCLAILLVRGARQTGIVSEQAADGGRVAHAGGAEDVVLRAMVQQERRDVAMPPIRRRPQRGPTVECPGVDVCAPIHHFLDGFPIAGERRCV